VRVLPALNMPSLLTQTAAAAISPLGARSVLLVDNLLVLMGWTAVLVPFGLVGGFIYLNGVARTVRVAWPLQEQPPADQAPAANSAGAGRVTEAQETQGAGTRRLSSGVSKFIRVSLFSGGILGIAAVFALPWLFLLVAVMAT